MKNSIICEIGYLPSPHLNQIYKGFELLEKQKIISKLIVQPVTGDMLKPLLTVTLNKKIRIIYDTLDGLNWISGNKEENLHHFQQNINADFYFKRSYKPILQDFSPTGCKVFPLGLNYNITHNLKNKGLSDVRN